MTYVPRMNDIESMCGMTWCFVLVSISSLLSAQAADNFNAFFNSNAAGSEAKIVAFSIAENFVCVVRAVFAAGFVNFVHMLYYLWLC